MSLDNTTPTTWTPIENLKDEQIQVGTTLFFPGRILKVISSGLTTSIATIVDCHVAEYLSDEPETFFHIYFDGSIYKKRAYPGSESPNNKPYDVVFSIPSLRSYQVLVANVENIFLSLSAKYVL